MTSWAAQPGSALKGRGISGYMVLEQWSQPLHALVQTRQRVGRLLEAMQDGWLYHPRCPLD
jgi:hypothetical protein